MLPQAPADASVAKEIPAFCRIGPGPLIFGSLCVYATLLTLADALQWKDFEQGISSGIFTAFLAAILVTPAQCFLAMILMSDKQRGPWRTGGVLLPAAAISLLSVYTISTLYPHERRARNELERLLQGPVPPSVKNVTVDYVSGFTDTMWRLEFELAPEDWEKIRLYPPFEEKSRAPVGTSDSAHGQDGPLHYSLNYDFATRLCRCAVAG